MIFGSTVGYDSIYSYPYESRKITDLRLQISNIEESIWDLRNNRAGITKEITKLKNKNRKKYGIIIDDYSEKIIEEFETLKECYDYIDKAIVKKSIKSIRTINVPIILILINTNSIYMYFPLLN